MLLYTIEIEGDFLTFVGNDLTPQEGKKVSYRITLIKGVVTNDTDNYLTLVQIDSKTNAFNYTEVEDPTTPGVAFVDLNTFRTYMVTNLTV